jgi:RNA polymerase sigma-54 factor
MQLGMELNIAQKQTQTLALTPALIQAIRVLGLSRAELDDYIAEETEANPALETEPSEEDAVGRISEKTPQNGSETASEDVSERADDRAAADRRAEDFDWAEYLNEKNWDDVSYRYARGSVADSAGADALEWDVAGHRDSTLRDFLIEQLSTDDLSQTIGDSRLAGEIALYIIESLDDNGFLTQTVAEMAVAVSAKPAEVEAVLAVIRGFEPTGVGAGGLSECLILQLERNGKITPGIRTIILDHLPDVAVGHIAAIAKATGMKRKEIEQAVETIRGLDPKPGRGFAGSETIRYIVPDVVIEKGAAGDYEITINRAGIPSLMVSSYCRKVFQETPKGSAEHRFLTERLNAAVMLIKSLEQREQTIYNVINAIVHRQRAFFDKGRKHLKPLTLKMIGDELGIHESTVSRTIRGKYAQTPRGMFELKYFFGSGVRGAEGEGVAADGVKARIGEIISGEDARAPFSDDRIAELLREEGPLISRRTVAKYREEMGTPSSPLRRKRT